MASGRVAPFLAALDAPARARAEADPAALEELLEGAIAAACAEHPELPLDEPRLLAHFARHAGDDPLAALPSLALGDLFLACACAAGEPAALAAFDAEQLRPLGSALARTGAALATIDEVLQLVRVQLLVARDGAPPGIADYGGRGNLRSWLRVTALREVVRASARAEREVPLEDERLLESLFPAADPDRGHLQGLHYPEVKAAFEEALSALAPKERLLLRQSVLDGVSIDRIGALNGVHRATAARWVERARERLVARTRRGLARRLGASPSETESVLRLCLSRLDVSLQRLLG